MNIPDPATLRTWSRTMIVLRVLIGVSGVAALAIAGTGGVALVAILFGAFGLLSALWNPGGAGPGVLIAAALISWLIRYGVHPASITGTVLLVLAVAVHHQSAAFAAALPPTAKVNRAVIDRFVRHGCLVLGLTAVVAILALGVARPGGSVPLEILGLGAAVLAVAVPVLLSRLTLGAPEEGDG